MRRISRRNALERLARLRENFRAHVSKTFERKARSCDTCTTQGVCCLDEHFVNVQISKLEAEAISAVLDMLPSPQKEGVLARVEDAFKRYGLESNPDATYSCPLYDATKGCIVHIEAKPFPCISHACYERREDLPPDHLLTEQEGLIEGLNLRTYGRREPWLPIPLAIRRSRSNS